MGHADVFGNFDDGADVVLVSAGGAVRTNFHFGGNDFAGEGFGVGIGAGAGAGQADIYGVDAERFHEVEDFDFFGDGGIVDGGILQAVAEGFIVERDPAVAAISAPVKMFQSWIDRFAWFNFVG